MSQATNEIVEHIAFQLGVESVKAQVFQDAEKLIQDYTSIKIATLERQLAEVTDNASLWQGQLQESRRQLQQAHAEGARLKKGVEHWKENYRTELESADKQIKFWEEHLDTHGVNFHQGRRSALVSSDIALTPLRDLLNTSILGQDLIAELGRVKEESEGRLEDGIAMAQKADVLENQLDQCQEVLREVEWVYDSNGQNPICPSCVKDKPLGHKPDCRLAACLQGKVEGWVKVDQRVITAWFNCLNIPTGELASREEYKIVGDFFRAAMANAQKDGQ